MPRGEHDDPARERRGAAKCSNRGYDVKTGFGCKIWDNNDNCHVPNPCTTKREPQHREPFTPVRMEISKPTSLC